MKQSIYNYYTPYNEGVIFMNGITEATFWVSNEYANVFRQIIEDPDNFPEYADFINKLKNKGFILDNTVDEDEIIKFKYDSLRQPDEYRIMILPTYQCNLRCWYCVQDHINTKLDNETIKKIKELILSRVIDNPDIKTLNITWFGGEPLLEYDTVHEITRYAYNLAKQKSLNFICSITTNGTLLTRERIKELFEIGVSYYQITIDGAKNDHDSVKHLGNKSAFETTLDNIAYIAKRSQCILRFNYTKDTLKPELIISQINDRIPKEVRNNITLNLKAVWQTIGINEADYTQVLKMMDLAEDIGIIPSLKPTGLCYVDQLHYDCVYPSGVVGKCENGIKDMKHGILKNNGYIDFSNADTFHYKSVYETTQSECKECKYLPFCWGPCSQKRYLQLKSSNILHCIFSEKEKSMSHAIVRSYLTHKYHDSHDNK